MGLVKDVNPYDSDCNNLPSQESFPPVCFTVAVRNYL